MIDRSPDQRRKLPDDPRNGLDSARRRFRRVPFTVSGYRERSLPVQMMILEVEQEQRPLFYRYAAASDARVAAAAARSPARAGENPGKPAVPGAYVPHRRA